MSEIFISVVIPCYNEEKRIGSTLDSVIDFFKEQNLTFEIVVADDGSIDKSKEVVLKRATDGTNISFLESSVNRGKGNAVKRGMLAAIGNYALLTDADLSTPITELKHFLPLLNNDNKEQILIGTRKTTGANVTKHQPFIRENMGKVFTFLTNFILHMHQTDFTCGFKLFPIATRSKIFESSAIDRWGYDSEILFLAKIYKYRILEIPVVWENSEATKVDLIKDTLRSFKELLDIRVNQITGKY